MSSRRQGGGNINEEEMVEIELGDLKSPVVIKEATNGASINEEDIHIEI